MTERSKPSLQFALFISKHLADVIVGFLSSQDQWELLRTTILTILQHDCYEGGMFNVDSEV